MSDTTEAPTIGHNSNAGGIAAERLASFVERLERMEEEKQGLNEDMKDIFLEAKGTGFDVKIIRKILSIRKAYRKDRDKAKEEASLVELYADALGMEID